MSSALGYSSCSEHCLCCCRSAEATRGALDTIPAIVLAFALLASPAAASAARAVQGPAHVVDGDTIVVGSRIFSRANAQKMMSTARALPLAQTCP